MVLLVKLKVGFMVWSCIFKRVVWTQMMLFQQYVVPLLLLLSWRVPPSNGIDDKA